MSPRVLELRLNVSGKWKPGQHVLLWKNQRTARLYSIASHRERDGVLVLHIARHAEGEVSRWIHDQLQIGDQLRLSPANGHCVYEAEDASKPLLLVAIGTGLAAVLGVLKEALAQNHQGPISVYFAAAHPDEVYLCEELQQLAQQHSNLQVCVVSGATEQSSDAQQTEVLAFGDLLDAVRLNQKSLRGNRVYLCGAASAVAALQKLCFFAGAGRLDIITEAFP
nr:FAD-binding oxidoreductase [Aestuariicella hydrocarbonica]